MGWLGIVIRWIAQLFAPAIARAIADGLRKTEPYLPQIYDWVRTLAQLTPTRTDDEIMRAADAFGVPLLLRPESDVDRGAVLAEIVLAVARRTWPDAPERVVRRAIEIAYGGIRP